jgi:transcriptional regulator with AAA-type ATPase domain
MTYRLVAQLGSRILRFPLSEGESTVGSKSDCDIRLDHPSVSRRHALVHVEDGEVKVSDLGSRNGTRVGRKRVKIVHLRPGDALNFGAVRTVLEQIADDDALPAIEIQEHVETPPSSEGDDGTTLRSGPAETFVLEQFPLLLESIRKHRDSSLVAQLIGQSIFEGMPCTEVSIGPVEHNGEAIIFSARRDSQPGSPTFQVVVQRSDLEFRIAFPSEALKDLYQPLAMAVTALAEVVGSPAGGAPAPKNRATPNAVPLPTPPTVVHSMKTLYDQAARVAHSDLAILIIGESGTGKEVVARFIHQSSPVAGGPFLALNCASLPKDLLESELFGIEKGVATGVEARPGKFESAENGTLFLDEIGDMALETQANILRVLQSREVYRLGAQQPTPVSCRIIAATNRDIKSMLATGEFREDLYHRIAGWVVEIPPLRQRRGDIPNLAAYFLSTEASKIGLRVRGISKAAVDSLTAFSWPGNIRQLEQEMARAVLFLEDGELLDCGRLSDEIRCEGPGEQDGILAKALERVEADEITLALARHGSIDLAAEALGISRATLYRRIKALNLVGPQQQPDPDPQKS